MNQGKPSNKRCRNYCEKKKIAVVEDIITKTYSMNDQIQENIDELVKELISSLKQCTPALGKSSTIEATNFTSLKFALKHDLNALVDYFSDNPFKMTPGREKIFREEDESQEFHCMIANRILGGMSISNSIDEKEEQKKRNKTILDRFFGEEWEGSEKKEENEKEAEG